MFQSFRIIHVTPPKRKRTSKRLLLSASLHKRISITEPPKIVDIHPPLKLSNIITFSPPAQKSINHQYRFYSLCYFRTFWLTYDLEINTNQMQLKLSP